MTFLSDALPITDSTPRSFPSALDLKAQLSFIGRPGGVAIASDAPCEAPIRSAGRSGQVIDGQMIPVVGPSSSGDDLASAQTVRLLAPSGIAFGPDGTLHVTDPSGRQVCAVTPEGLIRLVAGSTNGYNDGLGADAQFRHPSDVAADTEGTLYVTDTGNDRIRRITLDGNVTTMAGWPPGGDHTARVQTSGCAGPPGSPWGPKVTSGSPITAIARCGASTS
ncbi:MAG: hypothetical protein ACP5P1_15185 [Acidimicrobiales bacterium]